MAGWQGSVRQRTDTEGLREEVKTLKGIRVSIDGGGGGHRSNWGGSRRKHGGPG